MILVGSRCLMTPVLAIPGNTKRSLYVNFNSEEIDGDVSLYLDNGYLAGKSTQYVFRRTLRRVSLIRSIAE